MVREIDGIWRLVTNEAGVLAKPVLQQVTFNIAAPRVRHDTLEGLAYLVVPTVMLTEGVHRGSGGALYYPAEELAKFPAVWDQKPVVVYHPTRNGTPISACDRDVLNSRRVGVLMNTHYDDGKLKTEVWLRADRLKEVDERILEAVEGGNPMEVSTGLFTDNEDEEGSWNGEAYTAIARNYRPDHLAILPDQKGACSLADGAGLLRNEGTKESMMEVLRMLARNAVDKSFQDVTEELRALLPEASGDPCMGPYVMDVYPDYFVYQSGEDIFRQGYKKGKEGLELKDAPEQVERTVVYEPVGNEEQRKEKQMEKSKIVDDLIKNEATAWTEEDRKKLMDLEDDFLSKLVPSVNAEDDDEEEDEDEEDKKNSKKKDNAEPTPKEKAKPEADPTGNVEPKPATPEEYIANAPEGMRDMLNAGLASHKAERGKLIKAITSNKANTFTEEKLESMSSDELQALALLANAGKPKDFSGRGDAASRTDNEDEEPLEPPTLNFAKKTA